MSQRNCEHRNAREFGDPLLVIKIGSLVGQGASLFSTAVRDGGAGQVGGRRQAERCDRRQCKWSERHGFRRVRVGEASNPDPPMTRSRARMESRLKQRCQGWKLPSPVSNILLRMNHATWKDDDREREEMGRRGGPERVARVGDVECPAVDPSIIRKR